MRIMVDLDAADVWRIQESAERLGITPGEVLRNEMASRRPSRDLPDAVSARVKAGWCDADIGADLNETNASIARVRRSLGLPANRITHRSGGGTRPLDAA